MGEKKITIVTCEQRNIQLNFTFSFFLNTWLDKS